MSQQIYPGHEFVFKFKDYVGTDSVVSDDGDVLASISEGSSGYTFTSESMPADFEAWMFYECAEGMVITEENRMLITVKSTQVPSVFNKYEFYLEDCNGKTATYSISDADVGKSCEIIHTALVFEKGFNRSYVVRAGIHFKEPEINHVPFSCTLSELAFSSSERPTYTNPQEVVDFLGLVTNRNERFIVSESTIPSYETLAKRIVEAEAWFENTTKAVFTEHRVLNEYRNADTALSTDMPYLGLYAQSFSGPNGSFYKGAPVKLIHRQIQPIDYEKGDKVEVRRFGSNWVTVPNEQVWADETKGILYIKALFFQADTSVRVSYRYGQGPPPQDARRAVLLKTALLIVETDWFRMKYPMSPDFNPSKSEAVKMWTWELKDLLRPYTSTFTVGGI